MPRFTEPLWGGLWTAEDPAFLEPGQLSGIQNAVYDANQNSLTRATGRSLFGIVVSATASANVDGLRDIQFDNGDQYLIAMTPSAYSTAGIEDGVFSLATAITGGNQLERIHYRNRYFLLNGVTASADSINTNKVFYLSATGAGTPLQIRQNGMLPVAAAPSTTAAASSFSQTVTGYYEYWTTEVAVLTQDGAELKLESAFSSDVNPSTVFVTSTGMAPIIQMPAVRNSITTHWRVYRSPKKDSISDRKFPTGFMIAEQATASAALMDTLTVASATSGPSLRNTSAPFNNWTNSDNATGTAANLIYASATGGVLGSLSQQLYYSFNFGGFSGTVKGIAVETAAYATAASMLPVPVTVTIGKRDPTTGGFKFNAQELFLRTLKIASKSVNVTSSTSGTPHVVTVGASGDRWFASNKTGLVDTDFDANFAVKFEVSKPGAVVGFDYVRATAYYSAVVDGTVQYPSVVYTFGDITSQVSKNFPPPNASTGDLFEDMVVLNDVTNPSLIRYSFAGDPESFPPTYFVDFETSENDRVTNIKVVNNVLMVGLETSLWRVNSLPTERNSEFKREIEAVARAYGIVNEMCACVYSKPGYGDRLAFVSNNGIHETDGFSFETYTDGIDWSQIISRTSTSAPIALINDPEQMELLFYYQNNALGTERYKCLHLNYASGHLQNGRPKISGPVNMRNFDSGSGTFASLESAWTAARASGQTSVHLGYGGTATAAGAGSVYREGGTTIPSSDDRMAFVTRRMYKADMGNEWALENLYGYCGTYSGTPQLSYFVEKAKTNDAGAVLSTAKTITLAGQKLHRVVFSELSEGMRVSAVITASAFSQSQLVLEGEGWGEEDSGR